MSDDSCYRCDKCCWEGRHQRASGKEGFRKEPKVRCIGLLPAPPELLSESTRGALERLLTSQLPRELDWTATDLLRVTVDTVLYGAIRSAHPGIDDEQLRAVMPTARHDEQGVGP